MAAHNSGRLSEISVEDYAWGRYVTGTREMLVQHGYTQEGPFPGDPGVKKTSLQTKDPAGRAIGIRRRSKYLFDVSRDWSEEEKSWYDRRKAKEAKAERKKAEEERAALEQEKLREYARKQVANWPKTTREFRDKTIEHLDVSMRLVEHFLSCEPGSSGGYRFDDATGEKSRQLIGQLRGLIESGMVAMDFELRQQQIPDCLADELLTAEASICVGNVVPFRPAQSA